MNIDYVPLLQIARDLQDMPRGMARFRQYLRTIFDHIEMDFELIPLIAMNPMGKEHVTAILDTLLRMDADGIAARASAEASAALSDVPGDFKAGLVVSDDLKGGWTNRFANEFSIRFGSSNPRGDKDSALPTLEPPRWSKYLWVIGVLWSSEEPTERTVREAILTVAYRIAYTYRHGPARTLRERMVQEGQVMAQAGCISPTLEADDLDYTREVIQPFLECDDMRTTIECLFGDAAGRTLGFTPRGLSPWAGLSLALHDARRKLPHPKSDVESGAGAAGQN
jgi:hypothetical protein